ncbi:serine hydrolase FSH [Apiosordaria backusii]|uniref:Serine hydrolase FSH n=1 Tax=Apiosordaria backusii TaxID=314023 RepID=A0AA40BDP5_9PEZI|nr:serine hydrolase FSH [Apiosordaria backusii]
MSPQQDSKAFKVLCLHGIGTNCEILKLQTASLRQYLPSECTYDWYPGLYPSPPAPGIREMFGTNQQCFSYFDGSAKGGMEAVDKLADHLLTHGPFDTVLAFSMGGSLAATLLLRPDEQDPRLREAKSNIKSVMFLSSIMPSGWDELESGRVTFLKANKVPEEERIAIPTVHAWSNKDVHYPGMAKQVMNMCKEETRVEVKHSAGHGIPNVQEEARELGKVITEMLERV